MKLLALAVVLVSTTAAADAPASPAARQACADAMNADPTFARDIVNIALRQEVIGTTQLCASADTIKTHLEAADHVAKNERHVVLAYAAMWLIAAGFVVFLWLRQQRLRAEIAVLRKELADATKEAK